jgi:immune inhibitor A
VRKKSAGLLSLVLAAGLGTTLGAPAVTANASPIMKSPAITADHPDEVAGHELPNPLEDKRRALREEALTQVLNGEATPVRRNGSTVVKVSDVKSPAAVNAAGTTTAAASTESQYVELGREKTDRIFVVLAEFGNERHPSYPDKDLEPSIPGPTTFDGPARNAIPQPDRTKDNSTVWQPDYSRQHYQDLYFGEGGAEGAGAEHESVKQYYERQSSGRYSIAGTVTDWVKVRYNEARYGRSSDNPATNGNDPAVCSGHVCSNTWELVRDAVNQWYADQLAAGKTEAQVKADLATFDQWDRYDYNGNGNFNEPDGYIDHFQIVHAGGDEADGDPIQGEDAIWSHRWYTQTTPIGTGGQHGLGGSQIGDSGIWVGDYTIQPENGGMSVFAHEYGHDLGLPDLYDTAGGENSVNYWSLMAQSRVDGPNDDALGTRAADLGAWDKLMLGWLDYQAVLPSENRSLEVGPHEYNTDKAQAAVVVLPKKSVTSPLVTPYAGAKSWWSGTADDYTASMARQVALPAGASAALSFQANYSIEEGFDYYYVEVDDGSGWKSVPGTGTDPAVNNGVDGDTDGKWVPVTYDLSAYAGKTIGLRLRYVTDGGVQGNDPALVPGLFADELKVTSGSTTVLADGAETSPNGWTLSGFSSVGSSVTQQYDNYYIASHRDYVSFDKYLQSGPYNFGFLNTKPDWVERFPYQDGLLISYYDTSQSDNNTSTHPGEGLILPIDANPRPLVRVDGQLWRPRVAGYDMPFSLEKSDSFTLHVNGQANYIRGQAPQPTFLDSKSYWDAAQPAASVKVPNTGTEIKIQEQSGTTMKIKVSKR